MTTKTYTPDEINKRIAQMDGWKYYKSPRTGNLRAKRNEPIERGFNDVVIGILPNYTTDLNEAVRVAREWMKDCNTKRFILMAKLSSLGIKGTTQLIKHENPALAICTALVKADDEVKGEK